MFHVEQPARRGDRGEAPTPDPLDGEPDRAGEHGATPTANAADAPTPELPGYPERNACRALRAGGTRRRLLDERR